MTTSGNPHAGGARRIDRRMQWQDEAAAYGRIITRVFFDAWVGQDPAYHDRLYIHRDDTGDVSVASTLLCSYSGKAVPSPFLDWRANTAACYGCGRTELLPNWGRYPAHYPKRHRR